MKKILCFGDSNVFGYNPADGSRYPLEIRWGGLLKRHFFDCGIEIIEEGKCNRTTFKNAFGEEETGFLALEKFFIQNSSEELSDVILSIGINDLQKIYNADEAEIKAGFQKLIDIVRKYAPLAEILILSPPRMNKGVLKGFFGTLFDESSIEKSYELGRIYKAVAAENDCKFINLDEHIAASPLDGLHFEAEKHGKIFELVKNCLVERF